MSGGRFAVAPHELHSAAVTLRGVRAELSGGTRTGAGSVSVGEVGVPELSGAVADFCDKAFKASSLLAGAVDAASQKTDRAAEEYVRVDNSQLRPLAPP